MQTRRIFCLLVFLASFGNLLGQSTTPNSLEPGKKSVTYAPRHERANKFHKSKVTHTARYEFYKRVEKAAREKQRILKILSKSQYSDPRYFGHKRIPRRKPSYKMRYCNECGIRH